MLPLAVEYPLLDIIWTMFVFFAFVLWISLRTPRRTVVRLMAALPRSPR